jgi:glycosyltransferase involved in cell wall biosynthesis
MKLLMLTSHIGTGGITRYVLNLAQGLAERGHRVYVGSRGGAWEPRFRERRIELVGLPLKTKFIFSPRVFRSFAILRRFLDRERVDLIHANTRVTQFLAMLLSRSMGIPYMSTFHGHYRPRLFRRIFKCAGFRTIAISQDVALHLERDLHIPREKIRVVYSGVDEATYRPPLSREASRRKFGINGDVVVGILARLTPEKNHKTLLEAFDLFVKDYPGATLIVGGEGRLEGSLRSWVAERGLGKRVHFLQGFFAGHLIPSFDISVLPSIKEGFGLSVLECQLFGIPVVVSGEGGLREIVEDGVNGVVLRDPCDIEEVYGALRRLVEDRDFRQRVIEGGKRTVNEKFTLERMIDETEQIYKDVCERARR